VKASDLLSYLAAIVDDELQKGQQRLGERTATRVAYELGGQQFYIPFDRVRRARSIYTMFCAGDSYSDIARHFHMSENSVRRIVAQERQRRRQRQFTLLPQ
jgi:Mor family transcriptional regulator